jgi:hypothetical protein
LRWELGSNAGYNALQRAKNGRKHEPLALGIGIRPMPSRLCVVAWGRKHEPLALGIGMVSIVNLYWHVSCAAFRESQPPTSSVLADAVVCTFYKLSKSKTLWFASGHWLSF